MNMMPRSGKGEQARVHAIRRHRKRMRMVGGNHDEAASHLSWGRSTCGVNHTDTVRAGGWDGGGWAPPAAGPVVPKVSFCSLLRGSG